MRERLDGAERARLDQFHVDAVIAPEERDAAADRDRMDEQPVLVDQIQTGHLGSEFGASSAVTTVLAATFATPAVLPLVVLAQLGTPFRLGVPFDTLLVRSGLVPTLAYALGG